MARNSARSISQCAAAVKNASTSHSAAWIFIEGRMAPSRMPARLRRAAGAVFVDSSITRIFCAVGCNLRLVPVAHGEQHLLRVNEIAAFFAVIFEDSRLDDRVDRAALLAVRIAAQRVQAAKTRALRRLLFRELHRDLAREHVPARKHEAAPEL